ncbi:hypothetical protein [Methylomagnum sp.]
MNPRAILAAHYRASAAEADSPERRDHWTAKADYWQRQSGPALPSVKSTERPLGSP